MKKEVFEKFAYKALQYLDGTEAFLKEQLPDYFQQIVTYYAIQSYVFLFLSFISLAISLIIISKSLKVKEKSCWGEMAIPERHVVCIIIFSTIGIIATIVSIEQTKTALKATIAPKVFIVDYLRGKE